REEELIQQYSRIAGAMRAEFQGKLCTPIELERMLDEPDRTLRAEAWRAQAKSNLDAARALDRLFDEMYDTRQQIARNAGFANYRDYIFRAMDRVDYGPEDCATLHTAIERHVVPIAQQDLERRNAY